MKSNKEHDIIGICHSCKKEVKRTKKENYILLETPLKDITQKSITFLLHKKISCLLLATKEVFKELETEKKKYEEFLRFEDGDK